MAREGSCSGRPRVALALVLVALVALVVSGLVAWRSGGGTPVATIVDLPRPGPVRAALYLPALRSDASRSAFVLVLRASADGSEAALAAGFAATLQRDGFAVGDLACDLAAGAGIAGCADALASAAAAVMARARGAGCDVSRPALLGYGFGATIAAGIALDDALLARAQLRRAQIRAVIAMRGTYDLSDAAIDGHPDRDLIVGGFGDAAMRLAASPSARVRADAPPFVVLAAANDAPAWARLARSFALSLDRAGARDVARFVVPGRDARGLLDLGSERDELRVLVETYARRGPAALPLEGTWGVEQIWSMHPPVSSEPFWADERLVERRPIDDRFHAALLRIVADEYELAPYEGREYAAIPLAAYLASKGDAIGRGDWIVLTNVRHERVVISRSDVERYGPLIVIGIDDERNLFRLVAWYRMRRAYSWMPEGDRPPTMVRPVGAFLYFPTEPPAEVRNDTYAAYGLLPEGIRVSGDDPFAALRDAPDDVAAALWGREGCLDCHALRGAGSRAHHITAAKGEPHGAFALALDEYPPDVMYRFLFDQQALAESFGVAPLRLPEATAVGLYELATAR